MNGSERTSRRGFTLLELLMSILVIGLLMALIIGGAVFARRAAKETTSRQGLVNIVQAISAFRNEFGFVPPLVRDHDSPVQYVVTGGGNNPSRLAVYDPASVADELKLRVPTPGPSVTNPLDDNRYSEVSLAAYLVGSVQTPLGGGAGVPADLPIDGVRGPGLYKPKRNGSFAVPADVRDSASESSRTGERFQPFLSLQKSGVQVAEISAGPGGIAQLLDTNGVPIRYYTWVRGTLQGTRLVVTDYASLNVPAMVGRWYPDAVNPNPNAAWYAGFKLPPARDLAQNPKLRNATWAVVSAGADKVFGDEPLATLVALLGPVDAVNDPQGLKHRAKAEADNLVEVGE